ncbi:MAG: penicillin acylase family protein, partial [Vulcanimicrobiaceae bacterium]
MIQSADPTPIAAVFGALKRDSIALSICFIAVAGIYAFTVGLALHDAAATRGSAVAHGLYEPVTIVRDARDIPHIVAKNDHDLYFAEGYAQGSDRLFQLDLTRRYAYGRLSEVFGAKTLPLDEVQRAVDIGAVAARQLRALAPGDRAALVAFSDGINAAAKAQPLPVEFSMLLYRPARWTPKDSLAVSIVASLELADSWHEIFERDAVWRELGPRCFDAAFPLSDARYDVTVEGRHDGRVPAPRGDCFDAETAGRERAPAIGSNAWAAGGARSLDKHALVANDPHLDLTIPGIWYVVE